VLTLVCRQRQQHTARGKCVCFFSGKANKNLILF